MEQWKPIIEWEFYEVSNFGNVRNVHTNRRLKKGISSGRHVVSLSKNNIQKTHHIHQLVAIAFLGHVPCGMKIVVDHIDNNPHNNHVSNLQLISQRANTSRNKSNVSGFTGVEKLAKRFRARMHKDGKKIHIGTFDTAIEASNAYQNAIL